MKIPEFTLKSHLKNSFGSKDLQNKVGSINFFFANCHGYCPLIMKNLKRVHQNISAYDGIQMLSLSVTPNIDTIEQLKSFAQKNDIDSKNWHLISGERGTIYKIARNHLFADMALDLELEEDQFVHSEQVFVYDHRGFIRGIFNGNKRNDAKKIVRLLKRLDKEAKKSRTLN